MYCSIQEAWPDISKTSPGINPTSSNNHHNTINNSGINNSGINNEIERFNPNPFSNIYEKESRPELVNKNYHINDYPNHNMEHFKEKQTESNKQSNLVKVINICKK